MMKRVIAFFALFLAISCSIFAQNKWKAMPEPKDWSNYETKVNDLVVAKSIRFEKGTEKDSRKTVEFTEKTYEYLDEIAKFLILNPSVRIEIRSHSEGDGEFGNRLTSSRAKAIADYIIAKGIQSFRLNATGYSNTMPSEEWGNDRVEFKILSISED